MPRWASRIILEISDIRVERVQDITEEDAEAEGIAPLFDHDSIHKPRYRAELDLRPMPWLNYMWHGNVGKGIAQKQANAWGYQFSSYKDAVGSYSSLWQSIYGTWADNPWVWVVEFRRVGGEQ